MVNRYKECYVLRVAGYWVVALPSARPLVLSWWLGVLVAGIGV